MRRSAAARRSPDWQERNQWGDFFLAGLGSRVLIEEIYSNTPTYSLLPFSLLPFPLLPFSSQLYRRLILLGGDANLASIDH